MASDNNSGNEQSNSSSAIDDDILEITQVQPESKQEEERRFAARQREAILTDEMKFMADFDPENSMRKLKKSRRRYYQDGRPIVTADEFENCDCLEPRCPGCHYPCKSCGDSRCGSECRNNRRWIYETVEVEGRNKILKHPHSDSLYGYGYDA